jgi:hypothetical protein
MKISVRVKLHARQEAIRELEGTGMRIFEVCLRARPEKGEANRALIALLADHFRIPERRIRIVTGLTARRKIVEL